MTGQVKVRRDGNVGTIVLDHAARLNALTPGMISAIQQGLDDLHSDGRVRAVVLTGSGSSFCSGTDLNSISLVKFGEELPALDPSDVLAIQELLEYMLRFPRPLIAAVSGWVVGTGVALMLACDLVIASETTRIWVAEPHRGLSPGLTAPLLVWKAGAARAAEMLLVAKPVAAVAARELGLINEIQPDPLVWARASELASHIAEGAAESHQLTRQLLYETICEDLFMQLSIGAAQTATARTTMAAEERIRKFLEKASSGDEPAE